jgi:hypothetical protein
MQSYISGIPEGEYLPVIRHVAPWVQKGMCLAEFICLGMTSACGALRYHIPSSIGRLYIAASD